MLSVIDELAGTPKEVETTMERVWNQVSPTSDQIVRDISYFPRALDEIIQAEGAKVDDKKIRRGRRACRALVLHPDCQESLDARAAKWDLLDPDDEKKP